MPQLQLNARKMDPDIQRLTSASVMRIRQKSTFFSVLAAYLGYKQVPDDDPVVQTAAVDGRTMYINGKFWKGLTLKQRDGVLIHELLHCALHHVTRVGSRNPQKWNIAADFVVNAIVKKADYELPSPHLYDEKYEGKTAEEVYRMLPEPKCPKCGGGPPDPTKKDGGSGSCKCDNQFPSDLLPGAGNDAERNKIEKTWAAARQAAATQAKMHGRGHLDDALAISDQESAVDWRTVLWEHLSMNVFDFEEFDRRFYHSQLYVEHLAPTDQTLEAAIIIDTSGSCMGDVMNKFRAEVKSIMSLYKRTNITLYWEDDEIIGPFLLNDDETHLDRPKGGGGTSFVPAAREVEEKKYEVVIYLTDGYGTFADSQPECCKAWLWCVSPGGLNNDQFPWGKTVRMLDD